MLIKFEDVLQLIGCTSLKMKQNIEALYSDSPNSFKTKFNAGQVDYNEYCKFNDRIATMVESNGKGLYLNTYWLNDKGKPHLHYVITPSQVDTTYVVRREAHNNSNFVGKILKQKEGMENGPLANVYIYDQSGNKNIFIDSGNLVGIAKYYMVRIQDKCYVHLVYKNNQLSKTDNAKIEEVSTYYKVPDKILEKMTQQSISTNSLPKELKDIIAEDITQGFTKALLNNLEKFIEQLEGTDDNKTDNNADNDKDDENNFFKK